MLRYIIVLAAVLTTAPLSAQTDTLVEWPVGSRVRVWTTASRNVVGQLKEMRADTLVLEMTGLLTHKVKLLASSAVRVDVSDGQRLSPANIAKGALGGAALGVLTTLIRDEALGHVCPLGECEEPGADYRLAAVLGAAVGAAAGATNLADRWREVPVPGRLTIAPRARRTAIGVTLSFR